jgi:hypothetical protein
MGYAGEFEISKNKLSLQLHGLPIPPGTQLKSKYNREKDITAKTEYPVKDYSAK